LELRRFPLSESFSGGTDQNYRRFLPLHSSKWERLFERPDSRDRIAQVPTGTIEIETIPIRFRNRVQLSIPLSVFFFLAQFLETLRLA
jgi:hypothetical protein